MFNTYRVVKEAPESFRAIKPFTLKPGRTIAKRRELYLALGQRFNTWMMMSDEELFKELRSHFPRIKEASRAECIKFLTMDHVEKMIGE